MDFVVGKSPRRKEGYEKVTGKAKYIDDMDFEGCLYGKTVRSTVAHGKIKKISYDPAIPWDEFTLVTADDIPGKNVVAIIEMDEPSLAKEEVRYIGEPVLLIAHPDQSMVERALRYVHIEYEELPAILSIEESLKAEKPQFKEDNVFKYIHFNKGNLEQAWSQADLVLEGEYTTGAQEHLYIEPQGVVSIASPEKGVTVWGSMQCPFYVHKALTCLFGVPEERVRVIFAMTGGGFGGKEEFPSNLAGHAALLSWKAHGKAVKMIYTRAEDMLATTKRHPSKTHIKSAFSKDGKMVGLKIECWMDGGAYVTVSPVVLSRGVLHSFGPYLCPHVEIVGRAVFTNSAPYGAFRGFGAPQTIFAMERHLDEAAHKLGMEPHQLRLKNLLHRGDTMATGQEIKENLSLEEVLTKAMDESRYLEKQTEYRLFNQANPKKKKGIGLSLFFHGSGFTGSGEVFLASKAGVKAREDGTVEILSAQTEMGQGAFTTLSQIVADELRLPLDAVSHPHPDTSKVPNSGPTVASRTCMIVGKLLKDAAGDLVETLRNFADLPREYTVESFQGAIRKYAKEKGELSLIRQYRHPQGVLWDEKSYQGSAYAAYAWACYVADVEVDLVTYQAEVKDFVAVQEIGKAIHPIIAAGQIEGGVAQAIGWTLFENVVMKNGAMVNNQFTNYIIPSAVDAPSIRVYFLENAYENGPFGAKGIGELPMDGPAPAIVNALSFALERQAIRSVPVLPEKIMEIVEG